MRTLLGLALLLAAGTAAGAEAYRWVDEKGVTNFGEKPPANRPARAVNTTPSGIVEGGAQFTEIAEAERRRAQDEARKAQVAAAAAAARTPRAVPARGMDFDVYIRLHRDMTEGELLVRAGPPDYRSVDNLIDTDRSFYYFPTIANPFTTIVKLRGGRIAAIERIKKF